MAAGECRQRGSTTTLATVCSRVSRGAWSALESSDQTFYLALFIWHSSSGFAAALRHDLPVTTNVCRVCWRHLDCELQALLICRISSADNDAKPNFMIDGSPLVSVVVPAFNAAKTISDTLRSISQQTYAALEIVVVDDGSTDETAEIARHHGETDSRVRVITKLNGGVASARNAGIHCTTGAFVAFIDADDLWHPTKIAKQLKVLLAGGPDMALVYAPFRLIDADGRVLASPHKYGVNGWVIHRHFYSNFVGNGSALLVRRSVLEEFGGFDSCLLQQGAEGCEDLLLQLRIATRYRFGEVSEYLVGYRTAARQHVVEHGPDDPLRHPGREQGLVRMPAHPRPVRRRDAEALRVAAVAHASARWAAAREPVAVCPPGRDKPCLRRRRVVVGGRGAGRQGQPRRYPNAAGQVRQRPSALLRTRSLDGIDLHHDTATSRALRRLARLDHAYRPVARPNGPHAIRPAPDQGLDDFDPRDLTCSCTYQKG